MFDTSNNWRLEHSTQAKRHPEFFVCHCVEQSFDTWSANSSWLLLSKLLMTRIFHGIHICQLPGTSFSTLSTFPLDYWLMHVLDCTNSQVAFYGQGTPLRMQHYSVDRDDKTINSPRGSNHKQVEWTTTTGSASCVCWDYIFMSQVSLQGVCKAKQSQQL